MQDRRPLLLLLGFFLILGYFMTRSQNEEPVRITEQKNVSKATTASRTTISKQTNAQPTRQPASVEAPTNPLKNVTSLCGFFSVSRYDKVESLRRDILNELRTSLDADDFHSLEWLMDLKASEERPPSKELIAMQSLSKAGLILGKTNEGAVNLNEAITGLESLRGVDSDNSAIELMLSSIYSRQGRSQEADEALQRGLNSRNFDLYIPGLMRRLLSSPKTSLGFVKALQLFMLMPIPDLDPLRDFLTVKTRDPRFQAGIFDLAQSIVDQAIQSRSPYNHLEWWLSSYVMSSTILRERGQDTPRVHSLNAEFSRFPEIPNISMGEACDEADLDRRIQEFQTTIRR